MRILLEVENQKASSLLEVLRSLPFVKTKTLPESKAGKSSRISLEKQYRLAKQESNEMLKDFRSVDGENWEDQY